MTTYSHVRIVKALFANFIYHQYFCLNLKSPIKDYIVSNSEKLLKSIGLTHLAHHLYGLLNISQSPCL